MTPLEILVLARNQRSVNGSATIMLVAYIKDAVPMLAAFKPRNVQTVVAPALPAPPSRDLAGMMNAVDRVMAVIEFNPDGAIISANANFSSAMGYGLDEIQGRHHRMFAEPSYAASDEYRRFRERLNRGEYVSGEFKRFAKGSREIWLQASYNPIMDASGKVARVVKFATDITEQKNRAIDATGQLEAINRSQAVIEFNLDGTIITANPNFCNAVGYALPDIKGRHHRMFVEPAYGSSMEYQQFWESLRRGEFQAAEYKRIGGDGRTIWIQASYNLIRNADGVPVKVVKYATDITATVEKRIRNEKLSNEIERELSGIADNISNVSRQASEVAGAASQTSETIRSVATAAEELTASINEISTSVASSKTSVEEAHKLTQSADASTMALTKTAEQMTGIVDADRRHCFADQPACAQRDDRVGAGRRSGARVRGLGGGSEAACGPGFGCDEDDLERDPRRTVGFGGRGFFAESDPGFGYDDFVEHLAGGGRCSAAIIGDVGNLGDDADGFGLDQRDRQGHRRDGEHHVVSRQLHGAGARKYAGASEVKRAAAYRRLPSGRTASTARMPKATISEMP
jgi:PAS domain S-box-containing protein